jgi:hypothetical protein
VKRGGRFPYKKSGRQPCCPPPLRSSLAFSWWSFANQNSTPAQQGRLRVSKSSATPHRKAQRNSPTASSPPGKPQRNSPHSVWWRIHPRMLPARREKCRAASRSSSRKARATALHRYRGGYTRRVLPARWRKCRAGCRGNQRTAQAVRGPPTGPPLYPPAPIGRGTGVSSISE